MKTFLFLIFNHLGFHFITPTTILRKPDSPVSITYVFLKLSKLFVDSKPMYVGFYRFLKRAGSFIICKFQNVFIGEPSMHELKSPSKISLSYLDASESIPLERQSRCDSILFLWFCAFADVIRLLWECHF